LTGRCDFNSNVHAATHLQGLAIVHDDDTPRMSDDGHPEMLLTLFRTEDATIVENWDTLGMRGTGSHDVEVNDLFIPAAQAVAFHPLEKPAPGYDVPLSYMTVWPPVSINAVPAIGIAQAAVEAFIELADKKAHAYTGVTLRDRPLAQMRLAKAQAKVNSARDYLYNTYERVWKTACEHRLLSMQERANCQQATTHALLSCTEAVDLIHTIIGTDAIRNDEPFQRFKRDIHVITQHAYFCEARMEAVGQVRLGLEPNWPFFYT
jgi:alkylation response protein AidB-like acyl-CoA dehydrogenase